MIGSYQAFSYQLTLDGIHYLIHKYTIINLMVAFEYYFMAKFQSQMSFIGNFWL